MTLTEFLFGLPPGPEISLFKQFRGRRDFLDKTSYGTLSDEEPLDETSKSQRLKMIDFLMEAIRDRAHPWEDYHELLQLSLVCLGGWSGNPPRFWTVPRQFVYGHFVYETSSTDISATDISSTTVHQRTRQLYIQLPFQQIIILINSNFYLHYYSFLSIPLPLTL